jgi:hypothetical protein
MSYKPSLEQIDSNQYLHNDFVKRVILYTTPLSYCAILTVLHQPSGMGV